MNINKLTIGQAKEIINIFRTAQTDLTVLPEVCTTSLNTMIGKKVIIRTYSAGVWFGTLLEKSGNEVIITNARRMWRWWAKESISLSAVAIYGINQDKSKIINSVNSVWLEAIEIIPCTDESITSIEGAKNVTAE